MSKPEDSPLGKPAAYSDRYDPGLLFSIARAPQRAALGIGDPLPFSGADLWTAYELSWLDPRGKPEVAIGRFTVPPESPRIVESKSLKLYLNSFSQTPFDSAAAVERVIAADLGAAFGAAVAIELVGPRALARLRLIELQGESIDDLAIEVHEYAPRRDLLAAAAAGPAVEETLVSDLFKSNCPVTGQPDWGSVQVRYRGPRIDRAGLLRYLVSYRQHAGFHEDCVERIFVDLHERCRPERLSVYACFTRRGGIDINPFRSDWEGLPPAGVRTARQ
jgi:7-cyano-7-deazaguanine reductase